MSQAQRAIPDAITEAVRGDDRTVELVEKEDNYGIQILIGGERIFRKYGLIHEAFDHLSQRRTRKITVGGAELIDEITGEPFNQFC